MLDSPKSESPRDDLRIDGAAAGQVLAPGSRVEQRVQPVAIAVRDADHGVGVHHVLDQRDVLVADPLDVVGPVAVIEHGRAFERLDRDDPRAVRLLHMISGAERPARSGPGDEGGERQIGVAVAKVGIDRLQRRPGAAVMPEIVGEFGELVEDRVGRVPLQLIARVVDFLDVALRARRADDVVGVLDPFAQPVEPLGAHPLRQDRHAAHPHDARDRDPAAAVVPGRRPDRLVPGRIEPSGDQPGDQAGIGGEHLVRADHREAVA